MPRKTKDEELNTTKSTVKKVATKVTKKSSSKKTDIPKNSVSVNKTAKTSKKSPNKKTTSSTVDRTSKSTSKAKKTSGTNTTSKKTTTKTTTKRDTKKSTSKTSTKRSTKKVIKPTVVEYYDLPQVYNKTVVKILAQTPSCLFVYWEISNKDKEALQNQYGEGFFQDTKPYLVITNETMNYTFETEINDYANSWYIHINDSDCKYSIKLIRKPISKDINIILPSINITSSNEMDAPNDHILFDKLGKTVFFRNVKTNVVDEKDISSISFINNIGRIYNIYDLYKEIYKNELDGDELGNNLSSSQFSSTYR